MKHRTARCPACMLVMSSNRIKKHRRTDACSGRPLPTPTRCERCGLPWPCTPCEVYELVRLGSREVDIARYFGFTILRVRRELSFLRRRGDLADHEGFG